MLMKRTFYLYLIITIAIYSKLNADTTLMNQLRSYNTPNPSYRDSNLSLRERLTNWFPNHFVIYIDNHYYLSTPRVNDIRSDFYIKYNVFSNRNSVIPDTTAYFTEDYIRFRNNETIPANGLSNNDFYDIKNQLAWLTVLFRAVGSPLPDVMLTTYDEVETYVIVNEYNLRQKVILPSFTETMKKLNHFYQGYTSYFQMNEIIKINNRIEFYGTMFLKNHASNDTDFVDVRFHTNRQNQIDLIMFFIYRNI